MKIKIKNVIIILLPSSFDPGSQTFSFSPEGVFPELGHPRYHHIPALANLSAFLQLFKAFLPHHHCNVTKNKIRNILPISLRLL